MKGNTAFTINKKLILHFDVDNVLKLPDSQDKELFVRTPLYRSTNYARGGYGENYKKILKKMTKSQVGK